MTLTGWLLFFIILQFIHFAGTWKMYQAAGHKSWKALVPIYNSIVLMQIINRPKAWVILLFIPIVNLILFPVIWVETLRSFGKTSTKDTLLVLISLGFYLYYVNYTQTLNHRPDRDLKPSTAAGEWVSSILFAVVAATIVHTYFIQPYTIPTSSLEKSLLVGDFLFVSKFHYGARTPMTAISFPMVHDTIPLIKQKSYNPNIQFPYLRIPGLQKIKRNDIVVFSWPVDTVNAFQQYSDGKYHYKPIDKKTNYVKRCVGLPGDSLEVREGYVYINGEKNKLPDRAKLQFAHAFKTSNNFNPRHLLRYGITDPISGIDKANKAYVLPAVTEEAAEALKNHPNVSDVYRYKLGEKNQWDPNSFPYDDRYSWNTEFMGPLYIPQQGATVAITPKTIPLYKRIIEVYEGSELGIANTITVSQDQVLLNGTPITSYTFLQDYYWMMGDNRNNSEDARVWGFVPFNHIVGKPVFIWMSWDKNAQGLANKIRWERVFTTVGGSGEPVSYLRYFLIALVGWWIFNFFRKRKRKRA